MNRKSAEAKKMENIKIGITESGECSQNMSWRSKADKMTALILITKNITDRKFLKIAMGLKQKTIVHASITTLGGSFIEPNISSWEESIDVLNKFSKVFPQNQLVLRIDPIIPTDKVLYKINDLINQSLVKRIRFSFIDNYKHIANSGLVLPWKTFKPPIELVENAIGLMKDFENRGYTIECCSENYPALISHYWNQGCVSFTDYDILRLKYDHKDPIHIKKRKQRPTCNCLSSKTELIDLKIDPVRCTNGCLYCYWRDK